MRPRLVGIVALGFAPGKPPSSAWANTVLSALVAALAVAALALAPQARQAVAGVVARSPPGGLSHANVLVHGYVIAVLPAAVVRAATVTSVCVGLIAVAAGLVFFFGLDSGRTPARRSAAASTREAMAVPRRKARSR